MLIIVLLSGKNPAQVYAMEISFRLPVEIVLEGDKPVQTETFEIQMKALTRNAPMPEHTKNQQATIEIQGQGKKKFPVITFTQPGTYQYEIIQQKKNTEGYTYDSCVYNVTVYCTADVSKELEITVVALEQNEGKVKKEAVRFLNKYEVSKTPSEQNKPAQSENITPVKTGDNTPVYTWLCIFIINSFLILFVTMKRRSGKLQKAVFPKTKKMAIKYCIDIVK